MGIIICKLGLGTVALKRATNNVIHQQRFLHVVHHVHHNIDRGTFYIQLDDDCKYRIWKMLFMYYIDVQARAVLHYKIDGKVLDMQSVTVPAIYKGQGLARLLAETAFTYAIVNNYYMYLRCKYLQKYYHEVKNSDLEKRIVGPPHIFNGPDLTNPDSHATNELD